MLVGAILECLSILMQKEVINICDGARLGFISDLEIDIKTGHIVFLIVKNHRCCVSLFNKNDRYCKIKLKDVIKIGDETILVENFFCADCENS